MNVKKEPMENANIQKRLLSISEATVYLGIGRNSALKFLEEIGAKRTIGRPVLYDLKTIDEHLNQPMKEDS